MIFRTALLAAMLAGTATAAQAEDWRLVFQEDGMFVAVDADSFSGPRDRRTARAIIAVQDEVAATGYMGVTAALNCDARTIGAVSISIYDPQGVVLQEAPSDGDAPMQESDGTAGMGRAACEGKTLEGQAFPSSAAFVAWVAKGGPGA